MNDDSTLQVDMSTRNADPAPEALSEAESTWALRPHSHIVCFFIGPHPTELGCGCSCHKLKI